MTAGGTFNFSINSSTVGDNNNTNDAQNGIVINAIPSPSANISYSDASYCITNATSQQVIVNGVTGGTFSSTTGLNINSTTGEIKIGRAHV